MPPSDKDRSDEPQAESEPGELGRIRFFDGWSEDELQQFVRLARRATFAAGEPLIVEGEPGVSFVILISGEAEVTSGRRLVSRLGPGDHAGELSLIDGSPTSANVIALSPVEAFVVNESDFQDLLRTVPSLDRRILVTLTRLSRGPERSLREKAPQTQEEVLAQLQELREEALHAGSATAVAKQHERGKFTARERVEKLIDPGSFQELDTFVRHRTTDFEMQKNRPWGDAVVTGHGTIDGRQVCVFARTSRCSAGRWARRWPRRWARSWIWRPRIGCPVIGINDSAGARIQEGVESLGAYGEVFVRNVDVARRDPADLGSWARAPAARSIRPP